MSSDTTNGEKPADAAPSPLRSVHTTNFPAILDQLGSSLLVTTYQAGKLVVVRSDAGVINTHFRAFNKPMGMAVGRGRLAIGTAVDVWEFRNVPAVAAKLDPPGKHDACYLPRSAHVTGDVQIHEMAYVRRRALVRQHTLLVPGDARPRSQLRARLAAEVHLATNAG